MRLPHPELARLIAEGFTREYAVLFGRARDALLSILDVVGARGPLLIPSNLCPEVYVALAAAGHQPTLVAVSEATGLPEDGALAAAIRAPGPAGVVMPTHLYGYLQPCAETLAAARERGWFIVENDSLATGHRALGAPSLLAAGFPSVVSFGAGKIIDAGVGGAVLTNDAHLARQLLAAVERYLPAPAPAPAPAPDPEQAAWLGWIRRAKRGGAAERHACEAALFQLADPRRQAWPASAEAPLRRALENLPEHVAQRRDRAERWREALHEVGDPIEFSGWHQAAPWRLIGRIPAHRDRVLDALRAAGIDAGDNYPALDTFFPSRAGYAPGSDPASARRWQERVVNLWLTPDYPRERMRAAANLIAASIAASVQAA